MRQASRPPTTFYGESVRVNTARPLSARRQSKAASRAALSARCEIGDSLVRKRVHNIGRRRRTNKLTPLPRAGFGLWCGVVWQEEFLTKATPDKNLIRLLICMGEAMRTIAFKVRTASCGGTACVNSFGDEQLAVDMLANKLLFEVWSRTVPYVSLSHTHNTTVLFNWLVPALCLQALEYSHVCKYACSEEVPELQDMGGPVEGTAISSLISKVTKKREKSHSTPRY